MRAVLTRLMTMSVVVSYRLPTITLPGKSMVLTEASIPSTSDRMAVRLRSRAVAGAGCPPNGAPRNGLPAPRAVGPFAICLMSDRMRMDEPPGLPTQGALQCIHGFVCPRLFEIPCADGRHDDPAKEDKGRMTRARIPCR
jgi:hypothetical protein